LSLSKAVHVAAELGVADALADGPLSADELGHRVGADPDALERLLRALITRGVFRQRRDGRYDLSALAETLRSDAPAPMAGGALFYGSPQSPGALELAGRIGEDRPTQRPKVSKVDSKLQSH
jgi:hypothetical protein